MCTRLVIGFAAIVLSVSCAYGGDDRPEIPNHLAKAKVGEWATYTYTGGAPGSYEKHIIVAVDGEGDAREVRLKIEHYADGKLESTEERTITMDSVAKGIAQLKERAKDISSERITIGGRTINAVSIVVEKEDGKRRVIYVSDEVPATGMVKLWRSDPEKPSLELEDFGTN